MLECKICGKNLYKILTFSNLFKLNYNVHQECLENLVINGEVEVVPIESNIIIYDYVFEKINSDNNKEYLEFYYLMKTILKHMKNKEWSMMVLYDEFVEEFMLKHNPYLLINLTSKPILIISLEHMNLSILEQL